MRQITMGHSEIGSEEVREKYQKILGNNGIDKEIKEVIIMEPELKGEHMASACDYVTIKFADGSKELELFVKTLTNHPGIKEWSKEGAIFEKEAEFFNAILPDAKEFCVRKTGNDNLINYFPKCFYGDDKNTVLENLVQRGFYMLDKLDRQNLHQAEMVVTKLAKFHGVGHAMINEIGVEAFTKKYPYVFKEAILNEKMDAKMGPSFDNRINTCIKIIEENDSQSGKEAVEWLQNQLGKAFRIQADLIKAGPEEPLLVVNHGDCWNNNMMFRKDENGTITDHLLVDMQIVRYGSPTLDLSYFLFTSVKPEVRRKHWKSILKTYYDTLCETTTILGSSINMTYEELLENYSKKCLLGIFMAICFMSTIDAMKEIDLKACGTPDEAKRCYSSSIARWVSNNPERAKHISKDTIGVVAEYKKLIREFK